METGRIEACYISNGDCSIGDKGNSRSTPAMTREMAKLAARDENARLQPGEPRYEVYAIPLDEGGQFVHTFSGAVIDPLTEEVEWPAPQFGQRPKRM